MTNKFPAPTKASPVLGTAMRMAVFGAIVGGAVAAAKEVHAVKAGKTTKEDALLGVAREAGSTAVAVGTATAVVGALGFGPLLSTLGIAAAATGAKYAMDSLLTTKQPRPAPATATAGKAATAKKRKTAPKKAAAKKKTAGKTAPQKTAAKRTAATKTAPKPADRKAGAKADKA